LVLRLVANQYKNAKVDLTATTATTLYTCPTATTAIIKSILVSEDSGNADTITVTITDSASAIFSVFKVKAVGANTTVELLTAPLVIEESEIVKVTAATADRLHVVASLLEMTQAEIGLMSMATPYIPTNKYVSSLISTAGI
jgi:hypothetical protein